MSFQTGLLEALPPPPPPLEMNFNHPFLTRNPRKDHHAHQPLLAHQRKNIFAFKRRLHPRPASQKIMKLFSPPPEPARALFHKPPPPPTVMCSASKADNPARKPSASIYPSYMLTFGGPDKPDAPSPAKSDDSPDHRRTPKTLFDNPHVLPLPQKTSTFGALEDSLASSENSTAPPFSSKSITSPDKKPHMMIGDESTEVGSSYGNIEELKFDVRYSCPQDIHPQSPLKTELDEPPSTDRMSDRKHRKPVSVPKRL